MVEPMILGEETQLPPKYPKSSLNRTSFFNALAPQSERGQGLSIMDLDRTFNSTIYAIANNGTVNPWCDQAPIELITGKTSIPGQCVTVTASYTMWVTRLANNCVPVAYESANCTGTMRDLGNLSTPQCVVAAGAGVLGGDGGDVFESFKVFCS